MEGVANLLPTSGSFCMGESSSGAARHLGDFHTEANGNITVSPIDPEVRSLTVYVDVASSVRKESANIFS